MADFSPSTYGALIGLLTGGGIIPNVAGEISIHDAAGTSHNDIRQLIAALTARTTSLENLGVFVGSFATRAAVPTAETSFVGITVNDFVIVQEDETQDGAATMYVASAITAGVITWTFAYKFSTDITGKIDKIPAAVEGNIAVWNDEGQVIDGGPLASLLDIVIYDGAEIPDTLGKPEQIGICKTGVYIKKLVVDEEGLFLTGSQTTGGSKITATQNIDGFYKNMGENTLIPAGQSNSTSRAWGSPWFYNEEKQIVGGWNDSYGSNGTYNPVRQWGYWWFNKVQSPYDQTAINNALKQDNGSADYYIQFPQPNPINGRPPWNNEITPPSGMGPGGSSAIWYTNSSYVGAFTFPNDDTRMRFTLQPASYKEVWFPFNLDEEVYPQPTEIVTVGTAVRTGDDLPSATALDYMYKTTSEAEAAAMALEYPNRAFAFPLETVFTKTTYEFTGAGVSVTLPVGVYQFECWGAQCGIPVPPQSNAYNNYGGYTKGVIHLTAPQTFYLFVGGQGGRGANTNGGWNGGGGNYAMSISLNDNSNGGGATDISIVDSAVTLDSFRRWVRTPASYIGRIMVAGGGGGGRASGAYGPSGMDNSAFGGSGVIAAQQIAGLQTRAGDHSIGNWTTRPATPGGFGFGASTGFTGDDDPAGGGGYYGGGIMADSFGGGGSSFISGAPGMDAVDSAGTHTGQPNHYSGLVFVGTEAKPGVKTGNGRIVITPIATWSIKMVLE